MDIFLGVLFIIISILLILVVLLQKGRGGGLSAALGGMGSTAFGTKTGDVFTWVTIVLTGLFLLVAVGSSLVFREPGGKVPTPTFQPEPGALRGPTAITIRCDKRGARIHYTLDGSRPTEDSPEYERPVRIEPPVTLKARAFYGKNEPSDVAEGRYLLGEPNQPPVEAPSTAAASTTQAPGPDAPARAVTAPASQAPVAPSSAPTAPAQEAKGDRPAGTRTPSTGPAAATAPGAADGP